MKKILATFLFILLILLPKKNFATHIVGGEIFYDYLGGNNYKITLKVYRDCFNGIPPFDNPAFVFVYNASGVLINTLSIAVPASVIIPATINNPCFTAPNNICVEEAVYVTNINLPPIIGGYFFSYQRCCRNNSILNLSAPGNVGTTYWCHIPGPEVVLVNSEPHFNLFPPIFICNGIPINFDHSATDSDGDSLAYKLCDPYNGLDPCCPLLNPALPPTPSAGSQCPFPPAACPVNAPPPPYATVPFLAPYSGTYPLSSSPAISINAVTGLLNGVPNLNGQWVVGVCVEEWRNGVLIGTHHRDFQFNVVPCPGLVVSAVLSQTTHCFGFTVNFNNQSQNGTSYLWNFGDQTTLADTSNLFQPTYMYPDTGNYSVSLIVNPYTLCADTSFTTFEVYPLLNPTFTQPAAECVVGNSFNFNATGTFAGNGTFSWAFGNSANPTTSSLQNPTNIVYSLPGTFAVALTISENGCTESYVDSVTVYPIPTAGFNGVPVIGCAPFLMQFTDSSIVGTPASYLWDFGDGTSSTLSNPSHLYSNVGVYNVTLTITTVAGCIGTSTFFVPAMVTTTPSPVANFTGTPTQTSIFEPWISFTDLSSGEIKWFYSFGDGQTDTIPNPMHTYGYAGIFNVMEVVTNQFGCTDTAYFPITIIPEYRFWIPNAFTPFNNDDINLVFMPVVLGVTDYEFLIFDRWGQLIFETQDIKKGWDGTYKGNKCQIDIYVWKITYTDVIDLLQHTHIGHVTLVK